VARPIARALRSLALILSVAGVSGCFGGSERGDSTAVPPASTSASLRRPIVIPSIGTGDPCPRTAGGRADPRIGITLGNGPAYPVLGMSEAPPSSKGVADLSDDLRREGWYWHKTMWAIAKDYRGSVLIRGRQVNGSHSLKFAAGDTTILRELLIPSDRRPDWEFFVSNTLLKASGCFGFQVDGDGFSKVIVFKAVGG
jgi:hypothetical protein